MHWIHLTDEDQLNHIITNSQSRPQVIFKHSTRCSISALALQRLKKSNTPADIDFYYLDILAHRPISNKIADIFQVHHESPQIIVVRDGECIYDESHLAISMDDIIEQAHAA